MKIFVTGACGQLGYDVVNNALARGHEVFASDIQMVYTVLNEAVTLPEAPYVQMDITDEEAVASVIGEIRPDVIIHCASWTAVDAAEAEENRDKVYAINVSGTGYVAKAAKECDAKMIYISSDYVFDGSGNIPWKPDDKNLAPLSVYGKSKLGGEAEVANILEKFFIVRASWAFGLNGYNFIKTMIRIGREKEEVRVVNDQIGTPTYTFDLARLLVDMAATDKYGYYHATNEGGFVSWYDFCVEFYNQYGLSAKVIPVTTEEYGLSKAVRPYNSRLDKTKLAETGFVPLPDWKDAVKRYLKEASL